MENLCYQKSTGVVYSYKKYSKKVYLPEIYTTFTHEEFADKFRIITPDILQQVDKYFDYDQFYNNLKL